MSDYYFPPSGKEAELLGIGSEERKKAGFPARLKELRDKKGESQAVLARALEVTKSTISLYETGDTVPDARTLRKMALHYDVTADYLLGLSSISTRDKKIGDAQSVTGLSEEAIKKMRFNHDMCGWVLNAFFEDEDFWEMCVGLVDLSEQITLLSDLLTEEKETREDKSLAILYTDTRLLKYEIRDAFADLIEKLIPTKQTLSEVNEYTDVHYYGTNTVKKADIDGGVEDAE